MAKDAVSLARFKLISVYLETFESLVAYLADFHRPMRLRQNLEQSTSKRNRDRMRPIVCTQFVDYVLDMKIDSVLGN